MKKLKLFIEKNKSILLILLLALLTRLFFFFSYHQIWWDSAVYVGMGKDIFSLGKQGLWEPIRPIVWPIILGFFWKLKLNPIFFGRLLNLIMSLAIIYLTFYITKKLYNQETALIASILISFSSIFFLFNYRLYTEIPAVFFALLAFYFYFKEKYFFLGLFLAFSFLTKFPALLFFICFMTIILWKKKFRKIPFLLYGFVIPVIPYLILNQNLYSNLLFSFISASTVIKKTLSCTLLMGYKWYSYFLFILKDNILNLFVIYGVYHTIKKYNKDKILLLLLFLFPLIYFIQLVCRQNYYIILFLPFLSILTAEGISNAIKKFNKKYFSKIIILIIIISLIFSLTTYFLTESKKPIPEREDFYRFAENKSIIYEIWITNPTINLYLPKKADLLYYPVYDINTIFNFQQYMQSHNISYIFLDTCNGGMTCAPEDIACQEKTKEFINSLTSYKFWLVYNKTRGRCNYYIFRK
ncbi:glycosyltransferase family 39 protein [Candidatus Woesearchaeota archaeon]|nr:glycosyltransferase family 39 protein [Candidatus Woesearchaeota archaeon]